MELTHDFVVPADVGTTWATFLDLETVGGCFPGATVTEATGETFAGTVKVKLGPIALLYTGSGRFLERDDDAYRAVLEAKGKDKRGNGTAGATVTMQLAASSEGTRVDVTTELQVTGKPAQFGRGVMQDVSDKLLLQFISCIEGRFAAAGAAAAAAKAESEPGTGAAATAGEEAPTPAEVFAGTSPEDVAVPATEPGAAPATPPPAPVRPAPAPAQADAIDLGTTVLPVIARTYAPHVTVAVLAFLLGWLFGRGRR